jgi:hypothetical protein
LEFSSLPPIFLKKGEGLEMELMISHACEVHGTSVVVNK